MLYALVLFVRVSVYEHWVISGFLKKLLDWGLVTLSELFLLVKVRGTELDLGGYVVFEKYCSDFFF